MSTLMGRLRWWQFKRQRRRLEYLLFKSEYRAAWDACRRDNDLLGVWPPSP